MIFENTEIKEITRTNTPQTLLVAVMNHPAVDYNVQPSDEPLLWFPMPSEQQGATWSDYYREKLAVVDPVQANRQITDFNQALANGSAIPLNFDVILVHRFNQQRIPREMGYGLVFQDDQVMVFTGHSFYDDKNAIYLGPGRGGYFWQYLPRTKNISHQMLKERLGIHYKTDRDWFLREWRKVI